MASGQATAGLFQFDRISGEPEPSVADHDNAPLSAEGVHQLRAFPTSWLAGEPAEIVDPYAALGTPPLPLPPTD